ncbi:MAG: LCP family protein [Candidatus Gottesmanbacteria bacterium]
MKRTRFSPYAILMLLVLVVIFLMGIVKLWRLNTDFTKQTGLNLLTVGKLIVDGGASLKSTDDRVNILLLGMAGGMHEGPDLTDTIIVASFHLKNRSIALITVPRDIWSETLKDKVNSAYHYGEAKKRGGGMTLSRAIIEDITGLPIHYIVTLDFTQFETIIDVLGGIDVMVTQSFTDTEYPIAGRENDLCDGDNTFPCRYETIHFDAGTQHMNGSTALKYVRSRHSEGDEGTDFARGKRQQDVMVALKEKIFQSKLWFHPSLAIKLLKTAEDATDTDMTVGEQLTIGKAAVQTKPDSFKKISIESFLIVPPTWMYGRYVLVPEKDYDTIHTYVQSELGK